MWKRSKFFVAYQFRHLSTYTKNKWKMSRLELFIFICNWEIFHHTPNISCGCNSSRGKFAWFTIVNIRKNETWKHLQRRWKKKFFSFLWLACFGSKNSTAAGNLTSTLESWVPLCEYFLINFSFLLPIRTQFFFIKAPCEACKIVSFSIYT